MAIRRNKSLLTQAAEFAESVLPTLETAVGAAKEAALPLLADAKGKAAPLLAEGRAIAADKAAAVASSVKSGASEPESVEASVEASPRRGGRLRKLLLLGGLAAVAAVIYQKLRGESTRDNWQSSYVPTPAPASTPTPEAGTAATAEAAAADDAAGASPDEALADSVEEAHEVTTPDAPAEVVEITEDASTEGGRS